MCFGWLDLGLVGGVWVVEQNRVVLSVGLGSPPWVCLPVRYRFGRTKSGELAVGLALLPWVARLLAVVLLWLRCGSRCGGIRLSRLWWQVMVLWR